jgi:hypothetical protein
MLTARDELKHAVSLLTESEAEAALKAISKRKPLTVVNCYLGEVNIATVRGKNDDWTITAETSACWAVIQRNTYPTYAEALDCVKKLVPEACRTFIREILIRGDKPTS